MYKNLLVTFPADSYPRTTTVIERKKNQLISKHAYSHLHCLGASELLLVSKDEPPARNIKLGGAFYVLMREGFLWAWGRSCLAVLPSGATIPFPHHYLLAHLSVAHRTTSHVDRLCDDRGISHGVAKIGTSTARLWQARLTRRIESPTASVIHCISCKFAQLCYRGLGWRV